MFDSLYINVQFSAQFTTNINVQFTTNINDSGLHYYYL